MADKVNVITIVGSLRKGSYNAALAKQLHKWQPAGMHITAAPAWAGDPRPRCTKLPRACSLRARPVVDPATRHAHLDRGDTR